MAAATPEQIARVPVDLDYLMLADLMHEHWHIGQTWTRLIPNDILLSKVWLASKCVFDPRKNGVMYFGLLKVMMDLYIIDTRMAGGMNGENKDCHIMPQIGVAKTRRWVCEGHKGDRYKVRRLDFPELKPFNRKPRKPRRQPGS